MRAQHPTLRYLSAGLKSTTLQVLITYYFYHLQKQKSNLLYIYIKCRLKLLKVSSLEYLLITSSPLFEFQVVFITVKKKDAAVSDFRSACPQVFELFGFDTQKYLQSQCFKLEAQKRKTVWIFQRQNFRYNMIKSFY